MRINKYLAASGIASRRKADDLVRSGQVMRNGQVITALGTDIDPARDIITVNGRRVRPTAEHHYIALHKPAGYVCTHARFEGERSIFSLLPPHYRGLKIAGRLDKASAGLVILSDDGEFVQQLSHPRYKKEKEYVVTVNRPLPGEALSRLRHGVRLDEGVATADRITPMKGTTYRLTLHQGWKRQIRRMMEAVGVSVTTLVRVRVGDYRLDRLPAGKFTEIKKTPSP